MKPIIKINELDALTPETLVLIDDEQGGISLGMKSNKLFKNIDFKFKKLDYKNTIFGIILLKLDETFYSCYVSLEYLKNLLYLKQLISLDFFNLIVFGNSNNHKVYRIQNNFKNKLLMNTFDMNNNNVHIKNPLLSNELNTQFSPEFLWKN